MNPPANGQHNPGGLRAWWYKLWQRPGVQVPPAAVAGNTPPDPVVAPDLSPLHPLTAVPPATAPITREMLLSLQPAGPAQDARPDLLQQRASFWATATHDLCQPAQALALFLERLRRLPPQSSADALHGYLQSSMQDLTRLLTGLMELAQIDAGELQVAHTAISVDALFSRVGGQLAAQAQAKGLRLELRSKGQWLVADAGLLERILLALGSNALEFCDRGTVLLSARPVQGGAAVRLDVSDSGPGIAERDHAKIFEPFAQRNVARTQGPSRPSLGLYIASRHAELMGTALQLRSALGRGSRFSLTLPLAAKARPIADPLRLAMETIGLDGLRVVLIDADTDRASTVKSLLSAWGCVLLPDQSLATAQGLRAQAILCAWQADAPQWAGQRIEAMRAQYGQPVPACILYAQVGLADTTHYVPAATVVLGTPLQAAPLRAWLRRALNAPAGAA